MALLELKNLTTEIALSKATVHALDRVSFDLSAGETLGIVGESGCGKTMTAMSIEQLLPPGGYLAGGEVLFEGRDLVGMPDSQLRRLRGSDIGMVFQDPSTSLNPVKRIGDQVAEPLLLHSDISRSAARAQVVDMFEKVGIPSPERRFDDYPHQLSGGQRQRVVIAMALICRPKLLIADEPTTALDVTIQKQILDLIDTLRADLNMAMILVTHDLGVIAGRADRVAVMYAGRIVELASTKELFARPRHRYTQALFEALPERVSGTAERLYSIPGLPPDLTDPPTGCRFAARCRFADDTCRSTDPELVDAGTAGAPHAHACFHPVTDDELAASGPALTDALVADGAPAIPVHVRADPIATDDRTWVAPTTEIPDDGVPLVQMTGLVKDFPVTGGILQRRVGAVSAVAGVDLTIERGQTLGLVGESGCGKTTLGRLVVGLERPTGGEILFRGRRIDRLRGSQRRLEQRNVQLMFQDSFASLDPRMRVRSILAEPLAIQHVGNSRDRENRVDELLEAVGLPLQAGDRYPHEFSGGQRQRIGLARALALQPGLIVADEPVSALDVSIQAQILNLMRELQRERQLTYLFISHDLSVIRYLSDVIAVMYLGKIVEVGPAAQVYASSQHPYTRGLIATIPVADPTIEQAKQRGGVAGELPSALNPPSGCRFRTRCPYAQDICAQEEPPLRVAAEAVTAPTGGPALDRRGRPLRTHEVACHFPLVAQGWAPSAQLSTAPTVHAPDLEAVDPD